MPDKERRIEERKFRFLAHTQIDVTVMATDLEHAKRLLDDMLASQDGKITLELKKEAFSLQVHDEPRGNSVLLAKMEEDAIGEGPPRRVFVLAGSPRQARDLARLRGFDSWSYVGERSDLRGAEGYRLVVYGDASVRDDYERILAIARGRRGVSVEFDAGDRGPGRPTI